MLDALTELILRREHVKSGLVLNPELEKMYENSRAEIESVLNGTEFFTVREDIDISLKEIQNMME